MSTTDWTSIATCGNQDAYKFLELITGILHFWDDLIDRDKTVHDDEINSKMWDVLIELPRNPFYERYFKELNPVLAVAIQNWFAANTFERVGNDAEKRIAFILRSSYVDLVTLTALICGGYEHAKKLTPKIREFAHDEGYEKYLENLDTEAKLRG